MRTLITRKVVDFVPTFGAHPEGGCLVLSEDGDFAITVDTGFNGGIAIPLEMMDKMDMEFFGYDTFTLATGDIVELPMFMGKVILYLDFQTCSEKHHRSTQLMYGLSKHKPPCHQFPQFDLNFPHMFSLLNRHR